MEVFAPMFILCKTLKHVKIALRDFNKKYFSKISDRFLIAKKAIEDAQSMMQQNPVNLDIQRTESILVKEYVKVMKTELIVNKQIRK